MSEREWLKTTDDRCSYCDGTGDVIGYDGEWRGFCPCAAGIALKAECKLSTEASIGKAQGGE